MDPTSRVPADAPGPAVPPVEPRQRWRVRFRRRADAPALPQREQLAAWEAALGVSGLPLAGLDLPVPRPRIVFAAPLGVGMPAEGELVDLLLVDRRTVAEVRVRLAGSLPTGHELIDVHDVWLGEPPLSGQVVAADYVVELATTADLPDRVVLEDACRRLLRAATLPRTRDKGGRAIAYDLRPLLGGVEVLAAKPGTATRGTAARLRIRTRFDPERGVGRPEEVLAALSEVTGAQLAAASVIREGLILAGGG